MSSKADPGAAGPRLTVERMSVSFGSFEALKAVSWSVRGGEILGIIGPNGAGKSTCFLGATNMVPHTGRLVLDGADVTALPAHRLARAGLRRTFQHNAFFAAMTVAENMAGALFETPPTSLAGSVFLPWLERRRRREIEAVACRHLVSCGVPATLHGHLPAELSFGTQRMLSVAIAAAPGARVVLLDEPAAGLGGPDMAALRTILVGMRDQGLAIVLIEHHMDLVMSVADAVMVIDAGEVIAAGRPAEIQADPRVRDAYLGKAA